MIWFFHGVDGRLFRFAELEVYSDVCSVPSARKPEPSSGKILPVKVVKDLVEVSLSSNVPIVLASGSTGKTDRGDEGQKEDIEHNDLSSKFTCQHHDHFVVGGNILGEDSENEEKCQCEEAGRQ